MRPLRSLALGIVGALALYGIVVAQSSTQGGGLSTKAIQALENCFDASQNFICGAAVGGVTTLGGTTNTIAKFTGSETIGDSRITDDGASIDMTTDEINIITSLGYVFYPDNSELTIADDPNFKSYVTFESFDGTQLHETATTQRFNAGGAALNSAAIGLSAGTPAVGERSFNALIALNTSHPAMDGSDFQRAVTLNVGRTADHIGTGNIVQGITVREIGGLGQDNDATESAFAVESSVAGTWDNFLSVQEQSGGADTAFFAVPFLTADRTYSWPDASGTVALGSGTINTVAKFTATGGPLGDSLITEDGTNVDFNASLTALTLNDNSITGARIIQSTTQMFLTAGTSSDDFMGINFGRSQVTLNNPVANTDLWEEIVVIPITAAGQTTNIFKYELTNSDHTGGTINGVLMSGIAGDPDAVETAFKIGAGWDFGLSILADGTATTNNITLGLSQTADAQIYFDGSALVFDVDGTATNGVIVDLADSSSASWVVRGSVSNFLTFIPANGVGFGNNFFEIQITTINELTSDVVNMLLLDLDDVEFDDAAGSSLNAVTVASITADSDVIYSALDLGAGWDFFLKSDVHTAAVTDDPGTNEVALYLDESTDRGAGTGTADCALILRLSDSTEIAMTPILVTDGGCP